MKNKTTFEKYNVILIILFFIIPIFALNLSYYFLEYININRLAKDQALKASQEVETLASEADFSDEIGMLFRDFCDVIIKGTKSQLGDKAIFVDYLDKNNNIIFKSPFPKYNLYVFKKSFDKKDSELIYYKGKIDCGKRVLCKAFNALYELKNNIIEYDKVKNNIFIKSLIGKYSDVEVIAKEKRGFPTHTNGIHNCSWFIWDYFNDSQDNVYGCIFVCDEISNHDEYGRLLALQRLRTRGFATGAFIPVFKGYGEANILPPLDKSKTFLKWANSLTIQEEKDFYKWLKFSLPQGVILGNYTAYTYLDRGASHIAVILIRSLKGFTFPKWLIFIDFFTILIIFVFLFYGIVFGYFPRISLTTRFILSYFLVSVLPVSLLCVTAYGYLLRYESTSIDQAKNELIISLNKFDSTKLDIVKEYRATFFKALEDPLFIQLIKDKGIKEESVAKRIVDIFESSENRNPLPILCVKIIDKDGEGAFVKGKLYDSNIDGETLIKSNLSSQVTMLRKELKAVNPDIEEVYKTEDIKEDLANTAYYSITGIPMFYDMSKHFGFPVYSKNGDFCSYYMFDLIKIDNEVKYMLFVAWDDKALDDSIIKRDFDEYNLKNLNVNNSNFVNFTSKNLDQNFYAIRVKGQDVEWLGKKTRHAFQYFEKKAKDLARISYLSKKSSTLVDEENIIAVMPSNNFSQTVFIGWVNKFDIVKDIYNRWAVFIFIISFALIILLICSIRSSAVFLKPISSLKEALDEVSFGNLNVGFKDNTKDELGQLSNEFSNMISELKEKERLSKLISDQAVQALQKRGNELLNDTETFKGVALVSDIRNFTGMSEKYDPVMITELLNEHFAEMAKIISDNGGHIYKFIGDAIEAVFQEKDDYDESAMERAYKAGSMMIAKLSVINNHRKKKDLFPYRIGVGLCYGTMFSGTVGSLETRLDYSILGDPLKMAAKFEALSIQNPAFPLVLGEDIAEKMALKGISFKKIDSKGNNFSVYVLNDKENNIEVDDSINSSKIDKTNNNEIDNIKLFSISNIFQLKEQWKDFIINFIIVFFIALFIVIGVYTVYNTRYKNLKSQSDKECSRLSDQLNCDELLRSVFDTLCFDFYEDISKILNSDEYKTLNFDQKIKKVAEKYEKLNIPMPMYFCCQYANNNSKNCKINEVSVKEFSDETSKALVNFAISLFTRKNREDKIKVVMGNSARIFNMNSVYYRRSAPAVVEGKKILVDTERIVSKDYKNILAYVFCGMPQDIDNSKLINYCPILAGNNILLAIRHNDDWYYSHFFPEKEKLFLKNSLNEDSIKNKGYYINDFKIGNESYRFYAITKELAKNNYSILKLNCFVFVFSIFILGFLIIVIRKKIFTQGSSVASKLRLDIIISALLPLLTVCFLFYLYINEDLNNKKSETISNLNKKIDEIERTQLYYNPYCDYYFKNLFNSEVFRNYINKINDTKGTIQNKYINSFRQHLIENVAGTNSNIHKILNKRDYQKTPFFSIREIIVMGKNGWLVSAVDNDTAKRSRFGNKQELSEFGKIISEVNKNIFFKKNQNTLNKSANESIEAKAEMMTETLVKTLKTVFGSDFCYKVINFPNNYISVGASYTIVGFCLYAYPNIIDPDYLLVSLVLYDANVLSDICNIRNDIVPYKQHIASGSIGEDIYCFYSANVRVGQSLFFEEDEKLINNREDLKSVKELGLAASWLNTGYLPVSRMVDLYGSHFLEGRQGNYVKDNVFLALASEIPLKNKAYKDLMALGSFILLCLFIIFVITQSVIYDLIAPIKRLIEGAVAASKGNYRFRTLFQRGDELGALCFSFDKMMKGLEEKQLMNRMVSKTALKVASNLSDTESKKVEVALLYVTVPGFDNIMKNTQPFELFSKLRKQIAVISEIVIDNGGDIDKIMGEKLLIAFRIGDKTPKEVAFNASKVASLIETSEKLYFKVSVVVNYGQVISGYLGVGEKRDFTIIGDPVNVAARIAVFGEKLDKAKCLVSETIFNYLDNNKAELLGEIELKGKSQPMKVYQLF